ncbi:hypothetical protein HDU81_005079 [Chytriomyces hyalinus]|nr:hypothetical protein HDU81_005079 [Chytriomyces hyalinus]
MSDRTTTAAISVAVLGFLYGVYALLVHPVYVNRLSAIPGPKPKNFPFTILGNIPEIIKEEAAAPYLRWAKQFKSGVIRYHHLFNRPRVLVYSSTGLRHVFGTHASRYGKDSKTFEQLNRVLGKGLLTVEDNLHKHHRAIINPVFRVKHINSLVPTFIASGVEMRNAWNAKLSTATSNQLEVELSEEMSKPTLDVIGRAGFGYEFNAVSDGQSPLYEQYKFVLSRFNISEALINTLLPFLNWIVPSRKRARTQFNLAAAEIQRNCREILETRKAAVASEKDAANDLVSVLLKANHAENEKSRLTDEDVMAQAMTFLAAGHETTSVALTWTLDFLANNPKVQQTLLAELRTQMPRPDSEPSLEYITSTKTYLDAVCKESLRLVPPAPLTSRIALQDDEIDGYFISKGTTVFVSPAVNHRLEEFWGPDVLEFKPERWMSSSPDSNGEADHEADSSATGKPYGAYMPFLLGPRNCIGQRFAVLEMKALLAVFVRGFEFVKVEQGIVKKKLLLTWKPNPGLQMKIQKVKE